jgi:dTDP-glucose 4,6-dehydratase
MKLLITGGAGFIGSNFIKRQLSLNPLGASEIKVLDKLTYAGNINNFTESELAQFQFVKGDICDPSLVAKLVKEVDIVINFAAESHVDRSIAGASEFVTTNTLGTQILLENSVKSDIQKFVQISTDEVYGSIEEGSWDEESPLLPNSPYSASKASADLLVRSYNRTFGLDTSITRCSNNYGPFQFPEKVIPLFVTNLLQNLQIPIYGTGLNVRDWLHVNDHCRGIELVTKSGRAGEVYNIGGGRELTNNEITSLILEAMGADESSIEYVKDRKGHDLRYSVDWTKINRELGYEPQIRFEDGLKETIQWYRDNEVWWKPLKKR